MGQERVKLHESFSERPSEWMGGEGEEVASSYLQSPKTKLRTSWLQQPEEAEMMKDLSTQSARVRSSATRSGTVATAPSTTPRSSRKSVSLGYQAALDIQNSMDHSLSRETDLHTLRSGRISQIMDKLRTSIHEDGVEKLQQKSWRGKDWDNVSASDDDEEEEEKAAPPPTDLELNRDAFKKSFRRSSDFFGGKGVSQELQAKNKSIESSQPKGKGGVVTKRRLANLKGLLQQGVFDQMDANNIQNRKTSTTNNKQEESTPSEGLLKLMIKASKTTVKQRQAETGRLFATDNKVLQKQYERAARKIQAFFKKSLHMIRKFRLDRRHLKSELKDIQKRGKQEKKEQQKRVDLAKQEIQLQLAQEYADKQQRMAQPEWEQYQQQAQSLKRELEELSQKNQQLQQDTTHETRNHEQFELEAQNPERLALNTQIERLEQDQQDWNKLKAHYQGAMNKTQEQIEAVTNHFLAQQQIRKKTSKSIKKIIATQQNNHSLVEKFQTMKAKKDQKYKKFKEARSNGEYPIPTEEELQTTLAEQHEAEKQYFEQIRRTEQNRKERVVAEKTLDTPTEAQEQPTTDKLPRSTTSAPNQAVRVNTNVSISVDSEVPKILQPIKLEQAIHKSDSTGSTSNSPLKPSSSHSHSHRKHKKGKKRKSKIAKEQQEEKHVAELSD